MSYEWDPSIVCPKDPTATPERIADYKAYYKVKHEIVQSVAPSTIVEIGVRAGYSAWAFLSACPDAFYHGFDADNGKHGGQGGPWTWWAEQMLKEHGFNFEIHAPVNTQKLDEMPIKADFYHIDGDHTTSGVKHDMDICLAAASTGGVLLIDDYDYIDTVRYGVDEWLSSHDGEVDFEMIPSFRGEVLVTKR